jgi:hypothetical protein
MKLRKGILFFALACLTLWLTLLATRAIKPEQDRQKRQYDLGTSAWQGITRVQLLGDIDSGDMVLNPSQAGQITVTSWDSNTPAQLQLQRQGDTLIIQKLAQGRADAVRISSFKLPPQVRSIEARFIQLKVDDQTPHALPSLDLKGQSISVAGAVADLHIQLQTALPASAGADGCSGRKAATRLTLELNKAQKLHISAPNGSSIALREPRQGLSHVEAISLQTGDDSKLELDSLGLLNKISRLPPIANPSPSPALAAGCEQPSAGMPAEGDDASYSD